MSKARGRLFFQMNLFTCSMQEFKKVTGDNNTVVVTDIPWVTALAAAGCYSRLSDKNLIKFFAERVSLCYNPYTSGMPLGKYGFIFIWYVNGKRSVALQCLIAAGYEMIGDDSWNKTTISGEDKDMNGRGGTCERFLVGRKNVTTVESPQVFKKIVRNEALIPYYTSQSFSGPPFGGGHSSKPVKFYTSYLRKYVTKYGRYNFNSLKKLDLFTREVQPDFTSIGLEFNSVRIYKDYIRCDGCDLLPSMTEVSKAEFIYCEGYACGRGWHKTCLFNQHGFTFRAKEWNATGWTCPGCMSGDMIPCLLSDFSLPSDTKKHTEKKSAVIVAKAENPKYELSDNIKKRTLALLDEGKPVKMERARREKKKKSDDNYCFQEKKEGMKFRKELEGRLVTVNCYGGHFTVAKVLHVHNKKGYFIQWQKHKKGHQRAYYMNDDDVIQPLN